MAGGIGYQDLLKKSKKGKKVEASPSQSPAVNAPSPIVERSSPNAEKGNDQGGVVSKKRDRSCHAADAGSNWVIDVPEGGADHPSKKAKAVKDKDGQRKSSPALNLDNLTEADYDRFKQDPLLFSADVCKEAAGLITELR